MSDDSTNDPNDRVDFDELTMLGLAQAADTGDVPSPQVKERLLARLHADADTPAARPMPAGFSFIFEEEGWHPHPVPGIRMKMLSLDRARDIATILLDVAPGTRFPPHHHDGAEECYVVSGSLYACGRKIFAGDFHHADGQTDHGELWTEEGCRVILVVQPEDYFPDPVRR